MHMKRAPRRRSLIFLLLAAGALMPAAATAQGMIEANVDLKGDDYRGLTLALPQPRLCQEACIKDMACRAWTFVPTGRTGAASTLLVEIRSAESGPGRVLYVRRGAPASRCGIPPAAIERQTARGRADPVPAERQSLADGRGDRTTFGVSQGPSGHRAEILQGHAGDRHVPDRLPARPRLSHETIRCLLHRPIEATKGRARRAASNPAGDFRVAARQPQQFLIGLSHRLCAQHRPQERRAGVRRRPHLQRPAHSVAEAWNWNSRRLPSDTPTFFQAASIHELGHAFGLVHVDCFGYNQRNNASIMSYDPRWDTRGLTSSRGRFHPEDFFMLAQNKFAFPHFQFVRTKHDPDNKRRANPGCRLGSMTSHVGIKGSGPKCLVYPCP